MFEDPYHCLWCEELITFADQWAPVNGGRERLHRECMFRSVAGSATHIRQECRQFGGLKDCHECEVGLTKREAARAALREYFLRHYTTQN